MTEKNISITLGTLENSEPYVVDLIENPVLSIVGGSGVGKTSLVQPSINALNEKYTQKELEVMVLDVKNSNMWKYLTLKKQVNSHHSDYLTFVNLLEDVKSELYKRLESYTKLGVSTWSDYNEKAKHSGSEIEEQPLKVIIIEDAYRTFQDLEREDAEQHKLFKELVSDLSTKVRGTGIVLLIISQRSIDSSVPKQYLANTFINIGMKMNALNDYTHLFGRAIEPSEIEKLNKVAVGLVKTRSLENPFLITAPNFDRDAFIKSYKETEKLSNKLSNK